MAIPTVSSTGTIRLSGLPSASFLEAGEIVTGKVTEAGHGNASSIRIKGRLLNADIPPDLKAGKEYLLQVRSVFPKIILSVATADAHITLTAGTQKILRFSSDLFSILEKASLFLSEGSRSQSSVMKGLLGSLFGLFYTGDGAESIRKLISSLIGNSLSRDKNQKDIKEMLVKFLAGAEKGNSPVFAAVREETEALLKGIEIFRTASNDVYPIPFIFEDEAGVASFSHDGEEKEDSGEGKDHFFTLDCEMSSLGAVATSVRFTRSGLIILFRADNEAAVAAIKDSVPLLSEAIAGTGFKVRHVDSYIEGKGGAKEETQRNNRLNEGVDLSV